MAIHIQTSKKTVDLATPVARASRIRRDPPPPVKQVSAAGIKEREAWGIVIGIVSMALAMLVILIAISNAAGWSLREYTIYIR